MSRKGTTITLERYLIPGVGTSISAASQGGGARLFQSNSTVWTWILLSIVALLIIGYIIYSYKVASVTVNLMNKSIYDAEMQEERRDNQQEQTTWSSWWSWSNWWAPWGYQYPPKEVSLNRMYDPLSPPERSYVPPIPPMYLNRPPIPINISTRGYPTGYQQVGILVSEKAKKQLPLFGQQLYPGSRQWNYYTTSDSYHSVKLPITYKGLDCLDQSRGCDEIWDFSDGPITVPGYSEIDDFKVILYKTEIPHWM